MGRLLYDWLGFQGVDTFYIQVPGGAEKLTLKVSHGYLRDHQLLWPQACQILPVLQDSQGFHAKTL